MRPFGEIATSSDGHIGIVELRRPPNNFFTFQMIDEIGTALQEFDKEDQCRAVILCAEGKHFCAGADFSSGRDGGVGSAEGGRGGQNLYKRALRLFATRKPIVAAVQGAAVGGGLGLALAADFRVACPEARFSANFTKLGFHPGFGLTVTLPRLLGHQQAALLLYTGRRITGEVAADIGLVDIIVPQAEVREAAMKLAAEMAEAGPLAIEATRATLRRGLLDAVEAATNREYVEQEWLRHTDDFDEGTKAMAARRKPQFSAR